MKGYFAELFKSKGLERAHMIELMMQDERVVQQVADWVLTESESSQPKEDTVTCHCSTSKIEINLRLQSRDNSLLLRKLKGS